MTTNLEAIRPSAGADLAYLHQLTEGRGCEGALPSAFPDALLVALAKDFREVELVLTRDDGLNPNVGAPLFAVMNVLSHLSASASLDEEAFELSERGLVQALNRYQWAVEREIVSRITGISSGDDERSLLKALRNLLEQ